jgi:hypothetical protein
MSRSSNSDICNEPASRKALIAGARKAVESGRAQVLGDARPDDRATVTDQHHVVESQALLELGHLARQRHRISRGAFEDRDGHRTAVRSAEQTVDDLQFAAFAVTVVAVLGEPAAPAFRVAR